MTGFVAISRALWCDPDFDDAPMSQREAWIWMIAEAAWKPRKVRRGSAIISLGRGQLAHSIRFLAEAWGWHRARVERYLKALKNRDMIETATETGVSVITICNYDKYQSVGEAAETGVSAEPRQQRDSSETNYNKDNQLTSISPNGDKARKRASRLPEDWTPPEDWIDEAVERGLSRQRAYDEAESMRDWSRSSPKGAKLDWRAAWRGWVKRSLKDGGSRAKPADKHTALADVRRNAWLEAIAEREGECAGGYQNGHGSPPVLDGVARYLPGPDEASGGEGGRYDD